MHALLTALAFAASTQVPQPTKPRVVTIVAAGDIACDAAHGESAGGCHGKETAKLISAAHPDAVLPLGDLQYFAEDRATFESGYGASWGLFKSISYPVTGNHEYLMKDAAGYFDYWGTRAGQRGRGWYSFNLGTWHLIALNGNCDQAAVGGCGPDSEQLRWLHADLRAHPRGCRLAFWHQPRFSTGPHFNNAAYDGFWRALYGARVDVVLNGHDHNYERFAPIDPDEHPQHDGITEFVVGTGGRNHSLFLFPESDLTVTRNRDTFGILIMKLGPRGYSFRFAGEAGSTFTDSGSASCHRP